MKKFFVTGIGTDIGKTVVSAIVVEALNADYWKPVQAGDLEYSDTDRVRDWVSNARSKFHENAFALQTPMSPHAAAEIDGLEILPDSIVEPVVDNHLVIEGAGGILVPLNRVNTVADLIREDYGVLVVSRNYLGSINHTLLTLEVLKQRGIKVEGLIFNGPEVPSTESVIEEQSGVPVLGRIEEEEIINASVVSMYAGRFRKRLQELL